MKVQVIKFNNITLRPMSINDASSFRKWFGDKEVVKYLIRQKPSSQKESVKWIRVELMVYSDNVRAKKLYKKLGFVFEGRQRQKLYNSITKKFEDDEIYSILRQEYK